MRVLSFASYQRPFAVEIVDAYAATIFMDHDSITFDVEYQWTSFSSISHEWQPNDAAFLIGISRGSADLPLASRSGPRSAGLLMVSRDSPLGRSIAHQ